MPSPEKLVSRLPLVVNRAALKRSNCPDHALTTILPSVCSTTPVERTTPLLLLS